MIQALHLPKAPLQLKRKNQDLWIHCLIRKKDLRLTPEEWVRQHTIYAIHLGGISLGKIMVENGLKFNVLNKRTDIVVVNEYGLPHLIVECKAPSVELNVDVFQQWSNYQQILQAPFGVLTNGLESIFIDTEKKETESITDADLFVRYIESKILKINV